MGQYQPLFNISLKHSFFRNGDLPGVNLIPTPETQRLMNNTNLLVRPRSDGVTVFFDLDYLDSLRLYASDDIEPLRIDFDCEVEQGQFLNFTDDVAFAENRTLFFDSANTDPKFIGEKKLHDADYVSSDDLIDRPRAALGLRNTALGRISISVSGEELERLGGDASAAYNKYQISFRARATHWKYYLVGDANREGAYVKDAGEKIDFDDLGEEQLANGRMARVFLSRQPIPLSERGKPKFQLLVPLNNRVKVLVRRLAIASAKRINRVRVEDRELFVSEIYVNF